MVDAQDVSTPSGTKVAEAPNSRQQSDAPTDRRRINASGDLQLRAVRAIKG
jgi:hypothetical protein